MPTHHCLISLLKNRLSLCSTEAANYTLASFRVNSFFTFFFAASEAALPPRPPLKNPEQHSEIIHHSSQIVNDFNYLDNLFRPTSPSASHPVSAYPAEGDAHYIDLDFPVNSFFEIILSGNNASNFLFAGLSNKRHSCAHHMRRIDDLLIQVNRALL